MRRCQVRSVLACLVLLCVASASMADVARIGRGAKPVYLTGRVIDEAGQPVAGVKVTATSNAMGRTLSRLFSERDAFGDSPFQGTSGEDGRFSIRVPYAQVRYNLYVFIGQPYRLKQHRSGVGVLAWPDAPPAELVVVPFDVTPAVFGRVLDSAGDPVVGRSITLLSQYGQQWHTQTDDEGWYRFEGMRRPASAESELLVEAGDEVGCLQVPRWNKGGRFDVTLAKPATVTGRVTAMDSGEPIEGASVRLSIYGSSRLAWTTHTGPDGRFELTDLPPGEYHYGASSDTHVDRPGRGGGGGGRKLVLAAGGSADIRSFNMYLRAILRGRVLDHTGTPVPGAIIGFSKQYKAKAGQDALVYTDAQGRFEIRSGHFDYNYQALEAFHPLAGGDWRSVDELSPGQVVEGIELQAHGVARVQGRVTDTHGRPLAGVMCQYADRVSVGALSDADGRYDLGVVQLRPDEDEQPRRYPMLFLPKRPTEVFHEALPDEPGPYYIAVGRSLPLQPDDEIVQDASLVETDRLSFRGLVADEQGKPVSFARVYLLAGQVTDQTEEDNKKIAHFIEHRDGEQVRGLHSVGPRGRQEQSQLKDLFTAVTYEEGRWGLSFLRTDSDPRAVQRIRGRYVMPSEPDAPQAQALEWVTVLVVQGNPQQGEDVSYTLHPPKRIVADQSHYVVPLNEQDEE